MGIAFFNFGTEAHASSGTISPALPGGVLSGHVALLFVENGANDVLAASGWTLKQGFNIDANARINCFWRRCTGGDSNPSVTGATQDVQGNILVFSGCTASGDPISAISARTNAASTTVTADAITPTDTDSMIVFFGAQYDTGASASTFSGYSGTNPTFTEGFDNNFMGSVINTSIFGAYGLKTDLTTTGSRTATATSSLVSGAFLLSLIPQPTSANTGLLDNRIYQTKTYGAGGLRE